jgi:hypothetical protein
MVHVVIHVVDQRRKAKSDNCKADSSDQLPFPGHHQKNDKDNTGNHVNEETSELLSQSEFRVEGVKGKQTDKCDGQNAKNAGKPMKVFYCSCHNYFII